MPVVFREGGYRFFFYSNEGSPREPVHIHVGSGGADAKFWLRPDVIVAESFGFGPSALRELTHIIEDNRALIEEVWHEHFGDGGPLR